VAAPTTDGGVPGFGLDLSLPDDPELRAGARHDPWRERDRLSSGDPPAINRVASAFRKAGADLDLSYQYSTISQQVIGQAFTNNGSPVYDEQAHRSALPANFAEAGATLDGISRRLDVIAQELTTRAAAAVSDVDGLVSALDGRRRAWLAEVDAARNAQGLIPVESAGPLLARRAEVASGMQRLVDETGGRIATSVGEYEGVLTGAVALLADAGHVPGGPVQRPQDPAALRDYWMSIALSRAGINPAEWDPERGADALGPILHRAYEYYGDLYLENPSMQWAGMANMIGPSFAAGFFDLESLRDKARDVALDSTSPVVDTVAALSANELRFYETAFLSMQKEIFHDQAMMHEAYRGGGMQAIQELRDAGLIDSRTAQAWSQIDEGHRTGDQQLIAAGNTQLLRREQNDIIQDDYQRMYDRPVTGPAFTYMMTAIGEPSIPGARTFAEYRPLTVTVETPGPERIPFTPFDNPLQGEVEVQTPLPAGNLADFNDRWSYITADTLPAYQELLRDDPQRAKEIIGSDVAERIDDNRLHNRALDLAERFATDWQVGFDQ
jgi:hypothetical protein